MKLSVSVPKDVNRRFELEEHGLNGDNLSCLRTKRLNLGLLDWKVSSGGIELEFHDTIDDIIDVDPLIRNCFVWEIVLHSFLKNIVFNLKRKQHLNWEKKYTQNYLYARWHKILGKNTAGSHSARLDANQSKNKKQIKFILF